MSAGIVAWGVDALIASTLLIALVLAIRVPVRRAFGAPVAYALWALPVLRLVLPPLPAAWRESVAAPLAAPFTDVGQQVTVLIVPAVADGAAASAGLPAGMTLAIAWGLGAAAFIGWHVARYRRFRAAVLASATPLDKVGGITILASRAAAGPLAFGVARRFVAFPHDFEGRYDADERALALAHELGHHARGDLVANWVALMVLALHWFNPLAWLAFRAFRADQELANDAQVLARQGAAARHAYACAIVKAAHGGAIAAACHLHTVDDLKGRLRMLAREGVRGPRRIAGIAAIGGLTLGALGLSASGTRATAAVRERIEAATGVALPQAVAPEAPAPLAEPTAPAEPAADGAKPRRESRIVVVKDGRTTVYEGAEARAYAAANPPPAPPAPPASPVSPSFAAPAMPGMPAMPAVPALPEWGDRHVRVVTLHDGTDGDHGVEVPEIRSMRCPGDGDHPTTLTQEKDGRRRVIICTNRIERAANRAAEARARARVAERYAMHGALTGLEAARASIAANTRLDAETRAEVLAELDREIADHRREQHDDHDAD